jgi:ribonuclease D
VSALRVEKYTWIGRAVELKGLADRLEEAPILAVDTESNSLYAYRERVCLVQISTMQADYLIDPLAIQDLSPLAPIFANPKIEKVFHAAEYDVLCLRRDFGYQFANLFDTMLAARIVGWAKFGLGDILETEFGIQLDKRFQRANWGQRPLPGKLKDYARLDSRYLIQLRNRLREELEEKGRWRLAQEDFEHLCRLERDDSESTEENLCRVNGGGELPPRKYTVLLELCRYRDQVARQIDRPLFKVMGDKTLLAIAEACPTTLDELLATPGMSLGQLKRHGQNLLKAVQRGQGAPLAHLRRSPRPDPRVLARLEALRTWRKETARSLGVESDVILPKDLLYELVEANPRDAEGLGKIMQLYPWREAQYGESILKVLRKRN